MKLTSRLLSALVALCMLFTCAGALAEETEAGAKMPASMQRLLEASQTGALNSTATISMDTDSVLSLMTMFMGAGEEELPAIRAIIDIIASLSVESKSAGNVAALDFLIKDQKLFDMVMSMADGKIDITSSLFPTYALSADVFKMGMMTSMDASMPDALLALVAGIDEGIAPIVGENFENIMGEPQPGEYPDADGTVYTVLIPFQMDYHQMVQVGGIVINSLLSMEAFASAIPESEMSVEDMRAQITAMIEAELAKENFVVMTGSVYANEQNALLDAVMNIEAACVKLYASFPLTDTAANTVTASMIFAQGSPEDWDAYMEGIQTGEASGAIINFAFSGTVENAVEINNGAISMLVSGMNVGIDFSTATTLEGEFKQESAITLSIFDMPLVVLNEVTTVGDAPVVDQSGKTVIAFDESTGEEAMAPIADELQNVGVMSILNAMYTAMPAETDLIISMFSVGEGTTEEVTE